jgi:hypothetical protein
LANPTARHNQIHLPIYAGRGRPHEPLTPDDSMIALPVNLEAEYYHQVSRFLLDDRVAHPSRTGAGWQVGAGRNAGATEAGPYRTGNPLRRFK